MYADRLELLVFGSSLPSSAYGNVGAGAGPYEIAGGYFNPREAIP